MDYTLPAHMPMCSVSDSHMWGLSHIRNTVSKRFRRRLAVAGRPRSAAGGRGRSKFALLQSSYKPRIRIPCY
eukprot:5580746-Prymnesium_polylepis.1